MRGALHVALHHTVQKYDNTITEEASSTHIPHRGG